MSPQQQQILDGLRDAGGWVRPAALRDAIGSAGSVKSVHVQVHKMRRALGDLLHIESERIVPGQPRGSGRGYRLIRCDA